MGWGARNTEELLKKLIGKKKKKKLIGNRAQEAPNERRTKTGKQEMGKAGATLGRV